MTDKDRLVARRTASYETSQDIGPAHRRDAALPLLTWEWMTPEKAALILANCAPNRHLKEPVLKTLCGALERGEWGFGDSLVAIDLDDLLENGQHRLTAIVRTGISVWLPVMRGVTHTDQDVMDQVARRGIGDQLAIRGESEATSLGSAVNCALAYERIRTMDPKGRATFTIREKLRFLDAHPEIRESVRFGRMLDRFRFSTGLAIACHWVMSGLDVEDAEFFFQRLADGQGLVAGDPILTLRQALEKDLLEQRQMPFVRRAAITIRAWNAFRDGERLTKLQWSAGGRRPDTFPVAR